MKWRQLVEGTWVNAARVFDYPFVISIDTTNNQNGSTTISGIMTVSWPPSKANPFGIAVVSRQLERASFGATPGSCGEIGISMYRLVRRVLGCVLGRTWTTGRPTLGADFRESAGCSLLENWLVLSSP